MGYSQAHVHVRLSRSRRGEKLVISFAKLETYYGYSKFSFRGGRKRLPKFKFSAKFPIGLHVILQIRIKKFENDCYII